MVSKVIVVVPVGGIMVLVAVVGRAIVVVVVVGVVMVLMAVVDRAIVAVVVVVTVKVIIWQLYIVMTLS